MNKTAAPPQVCSNCHFFMQTSSKGLQQIGYCRVRRPDPYYEIDTDTPPDEHGNYAIRPKIARFPVVLNNMWCGEFDYKDEPSIMTTREVPCATKAIAAIANKIS